MENEKVVNLFVGALCFAAFAFNSCAPLKTVNDQTIKETKMDAAYENHFPRIEVYVANGDSKVKPPSYIDKTTYLLENNDVLSQSKLQFLPEFQEEKKDITLGHYFEMYVLNNLSQRTSLFPRSLDAYQKIKDKTTHKTIIDYETRLPEKVEIVWLDKDKWYINNVFYHLDLMPLIHSASQTITEPGFIESEMIPFMQFSFAIQRNIDERIRHLRIPSPTNQEFVKDKVLLVVAKSPGGPGSHSYTYTVYADGRVTTPGNTYYVPSYQLSHHQLVAIRNTLQTVNFDKLREVNTSAAQPHIHDGQTIHLEGYQKGRLSYQVGYDIIPTEITNFHTYFLGIIAALDLKKMSNK